MTEEIFFVLEMARDNIAELVSDLKCSYLPEKGWPPHIERSAEVLAEIDDLLAPYTESRAASVCPPSTGEGRT